MLAEFLVLICMLLVMFLPTFIMRSRNHKHKNLCFWLNLFFGWTIIAWIPLMIWSLVSDAT